MIQSSMNQLANIDNPYQGDAKKVLCLCSAGLLRSPTTANVLHREFGYNTRSAGLTDVALIPVSHALLLWAEEIIVMELFHNRLLINLLEWYHRSKCISQEHADEIMKKVIVLEIPDKFKYMDEELQKIILTKYKEAKGSGDER